MDACSVPSAGDYQDERCNLKGKSNSSLQRGDIIRGDECTRAAKGAEERGSITPSYRRKKETGAESLSRVGDDLTVSRIVIRCPSGKCVEGVSQVEPSVSKGLEVRASSHRL